MVEFFVVHTADIKLNGVNPRYWLHYHCLSDIQSPLSDSNTHLIRPSDTSEAYAARQGLVPFRQWVNLSHESLYLHGPFDFASVRRRKTRDRISASDWDALSKCTDKFSNEIPKRDLPTYTVHVDRGIHLIQKVSRVNDLLMGAATTPPSPQEPMYASKRSS